MRELWDMRLWEYVGNETPEVSETRAAGQKQGFKSSEARKHVGQACGTCCKREHEVR